MATTIRSLQADLKASGATQFKQKMVASAAAMRSFKNAAAGVTSALGAMGSTMAIATGALGAYAGAKGLIGATKASIELETATAELVKLLGEVPGKAAAEEIRDLSLEMAVAREELMGVAASAARLGIRGTDNLREFTRAMGMIGVAADDVSSQQAANAMARLAKITQTPVDEMLNLASALNVAEKEMADTFGGIMDAALRAAPGLSAIGASQPEIVALAGGLAQVSASAERAGTRLNRLASALANPENAADFGRALGMTAEQFRALVDQSPARAILSLAGAMREGGAAADILASTMRETGLKVVRGLAQNLPETTENLNLLNEAFDEGTSILEEYRRFAEISESRFQRLSNVMIEFASIVGKPVREALKGAAHDMAELATAGTGFMKLAEILASTVQTIISAVQIAFNVLEIGVTSVVSAAAAGFAAIARIANDLIIRPLNKAAELVGLDFKLALLDAAGAADMAATGTNAIWEDAKDIGKATRNAAASWGRTLGIIQDSAQATAETESQMQGVANAASSAAGGAQKLRMSLPDVGGLLDLQMQGVTDKFERLSRFTEGVVEAREGVASIKRQAREGAQRFARDLNLSKIQEEMRMVGRVADSVAQNISSAFNSIVSGSKSVDRAFTDMVGSILQQVQRLLIQRAVMELLGSLLIPSGPGPINVKPPNIGQLSTAGGMPALAAGGPARAGRPHLVGEKGPEVFVPERSGRVVPPGKLGSTTVHSKVEMNVVANDTRGFDRLLEERQGLLVQLVRQGLSEGM